MNMAAAYFFMHLSRFMMVFNHCEIPAVKKPHRFLYLANTDAEGYVCLPL
jgi:hypothetical protein